MNEIPKNPQSPNIPQQPLRVEQVKSENPDDVSTEFVDASKEMNEIPENPAYRSGVKVDNLENDMKVLAGNPKLVAQALEVAELAEKRYSEAGIKDPELKAQQVAKKFVEEFQ